MASRTEVIIQNCKFPHSGIIKLLEFCYQLCKVLLKCCIIIVRANRHIFQPVKEIGNMYRPAILYLCLLPYFYQLCNFCNIFCRIQYIIFMITVRFRSINIGIHLHISGKPHQALTSFIVPSAIEAFDKSSRLHHCIVFNLGIQKFLSVKRGEHHLKRGQTVINRIRILTQDHDGAILGTYYIRICFRKQFRI